VKGFFRRGTIVPLPRCLAGCEEREKSYNVSVRLSSFIAIQGRPMAELKMAVPHGQTATAARANFEKAITAAHAQHGRWIRQVEWSPSRSIAVLSGPGFRITLSLDDQNVYASGNVPLAIKMLEGPIRRFVEQTLSVNS
jgi:hypothetical protein